MTKIVEVWTRGYAHEDGTKRMIIEDDVDVKEAVSAKFGPYATISSIRAANPKPQPVYPEAYCRMMSQNDNS